MRDIFLELAPRAQRLTPSCSASELEQLKILPLPTEGSKPQQAGVAPALATDGAVCESDEDWLPCNPFNLPTDREVRLDNAEKSMRVYRMAFQVPPQSADPVLEVEV